MAAEIGAPAPDFTLLNHDRTAVSLSDLRGKKTLIVFIPFPFTRVCTSELCSLRDNLAALEEADTNVVAITCDSYGSNRAWAAAEGVSFPVLSDFWPHGAVATAYGCFNEGLGVADRATYVLEADGIVREVIRAESFGTAREISSYTEALAAL
ncbi:MAG TPA: redoxin domain-containing protein [Acidimicrobiia bacterium]|nr:redoxin domain-containing protein [Acidimicrobiia bacterium]